MIGTDQGMEGESLMLATSSGPHVRPDRRHRQRGQTGKRDVLAVRDGATRSLAGAGGLTMMAMTGTGIRVGLIGYGLAGAFFHAPLIATTPGLRLAAIVTGSRDRQRQARQDHPAARVVATPEGLLASPADLDLVVVATPNRTHVALASAALEAGLPVVVDKPLAASVRDAEGLVEQASRHGLLLTVFQNRRWDGDFMTVRRLLADAALGEVLRFESRFERWRPQIRPGWRERGATEEAGGVLYDLGSHLIDQALLLFGPVRNVYAELDRRRPGAEVEDDVFAALTHVDGVRTHLWMSSVTAIRGPRFRVLGAGSAYVKLGLDVQEEALRAGGRPDQPGWGQEPPDRWGLLGTDEGARPVATEPGDYRRFYVQLAAALREGAPPPVDPRDAVDVLRVVEAGRQSAQEARVVTLGPAA
jgi:predicted dehydrogenase